jgi:hypothetical protein
MAHRPRLQSRHFHEVHFSSSPPLRPQMMMSPEGRKIPDCADSSAASACDWLRTQRHLKNIHYCLRCRMQGTRLSSGMLPQLCRNPNSELFFLRTSKKPSNSRPKHYMLAKCINICKCTSSATSSDGSNWSMSAIPNSGESPAPDASSFPQRCSPVSSQICFDDVDLTDSVSCSKGDWFIPFVVSALKKYCTSTS